MKTKISAIIISASMLMQTGFVSASSSAFNLPDDINLIATSQYAGMNNASKGDQLNISWTNPDYEISSIVVTEETLGNISNGVSLTTEAGGFNCIQLKNLSSAQIYVITVSITDFAGEVRDYEVTGKPKTHMMNRRTEEGFKDIWNYKFEGVPAQGGYFIDFNEKAAGESSLKVVRNINTGESHFKTENDNYDPLEPGAEYEFSFWLKSGMKEEKPVYLQNDIYNHYYYLDVNDEWIKYTFKIYDIISSGGKYSYKLLNIDNGDIIEYNNLSTNRYCPRLRFTGSGKAWVDEMELHKYNADGALGANMYIDGNFEWGGSLGASVTAGDRDATFKWTNPNSKYITELSIINEIGMTESFVDKFDAWAVNTVTLSDIEKGTIYDYKLKMLVNGVTYYIPLGFTGGNVADDTGINVYPLRITKNGEALSQLESGVIKVSRIVDNKEGTEDFSGLLVAAVYHDDELVAMAESSNVIMAGASDEFATEITVPEITDDTFEIRVFLWDSIDGQNIVKGMKKFN